MSWFEAFTDMRSRVRAISSRESVFDNVPDGGSQGHTEIDRPEGERLRAVNELNARRGFIELRKERKGCGEG